MSKAFVNHTNHPSEQWSAAQRSAAEIYGAIIDVPFPSVLPTADSDDVHALVQSQLSKILALEPAAVLCQGEFNYTFDMVERLKRLGIPTMAACSERVVEEMIDADGSTRRNSTFRFVRFRDY